MTTICLQTLVMIDSTLDFVLTLGYMPFELTRINEKLESAKFNYQESTVVLLVVFVL